MKKIFISLLALAISIPSFSQGEVRASVGYEPFRFDTNVKFKDFSRIQDGFTVGGEWSPYRTENGILQLGMGIEHSFGRTTVNMIKENKNESGDVERVVVGSTTPIYLTAKINAIQLKDKKNNTTYDPLYFTTRVGYSINVGENAKLSNDKLVKSTLLSGPYAAIGVGGEYKYGFVEAVYGVNYISNPNEKLADGKLIHKVGISIGVKYDYNSKPMYEETNKVEQKDITTIMPKKEMVQEPKVETIYEYDMKGFDTKGPQLPEKTTVEVETKKSEPKFIEGQSIINFDFDRYVPNTLEYDKIVKTKNLLNTFKYVDVDISGHTDSRGSKTYNYKLGQKRADFVAGELNKLGIKDTVNIRTVKSYGEDKLKNKELTEKDRASNRRVEIDFSGWWDANEEVDK